MNHSSLSTTCCPPGRTISLEGRETLSCCGDTCPTRGRSSAQRLTVCVVYPRYTVGSRDRHPFCLFSPTWVIHLYKGQCWTRLLWHVYWLPLVRLFYLITAYHTCTLPFQHKLNCALIGTIVRNPVHLPVLWPSLASPLSVLPSLRYPHVQSPSSVLCFFPVMGIEMD
jgi:hypothetical protein